MCRIYFLNVTRIAIAFVVLSSSLFPQFAQTNLAHKGIVTSLAFSADGKYIASASTDRSVKVWKVSNGRLIRVLAGHHGPVNSVAFSPDGTVLISGSSDGNVKLWNVETGGGLGNINVGGEITCVGFSRDGKQIFVGGFNGLRVIDRSTLKTNYVLDTQGQGIVCAQFTPDDKGILGGSTRGLIFLWGSENGKLLRIFRGHQEATYVDSISVSSDGSTLISVGCLELKVWDIETGKEIYWLNKKINRDPSKVVFLPNSKSALCGDLASVYLWNTKTSEKMRQLSIKGHITQSLAVSPDAEIFAVGDLDGLIELINITTGDEVRTLTDQKGIITAVLDHNFPSDQVVSKF